MATIKEDLNGPGVEMVETHISWVFLFEQDVYKVKKPVSLGFLHQGTVDRRLEACKAEVSLNPRLATDVYLGVVPITRDARGRHRIGGDGPPVDWAVHMKRLADDGRADVRLGAGRLSFEDIDRVAVRIAGFHAAARCDDEIARFGAVEAIRRNVFENFAQTHDAIRTLVSEQEADEIEVWQSNFLGGHPDLFEARVDQRRIREGHGDLRLEHIYLDDKGGVTILDCIEFNDRFRHLDVCADIAFVSMDLAWHHRVDLAERFLAVYAREANDYDLFPLIDFYESYRAYVRGKVSSILAADKWAKFEARERAAREARRYFLLALASERRAVLPPVVVAVGGPIASGKSTVAEQISTLLMAPVVGTDRIRKFLAGVDPSESLGATAWTGAYAPEVTERIYAELLRRARAVVQSGRSVILDASFRSRQDRASAQSLARARGLPFLFVECHASEAVLTERLHRRDAERGVSDARAELLDDFIARWEPVDELAEGDHLMLDTAQPIEDSLQRIRTRLATWPPGMTG